MYMSTLPGSWIYILLSSSDYTRCKIGRTDGKPLKRFRNLRIGDANLTLQVVYYVPAKLASISKIESSIHYEFKGYRITNHEDTNSELFRVEFEQAEMYIDYLLESFLEQELSNRSNIHLDIPTKMYESDLRDIYEPDLHDRSFAEWVLRNTEE
ncbi:GIY-YIG nuclease family protein [uncultured Pseudomonas sp.]|uniref:GIY-YIG nuclease family protein n=1 Tax=uncultured Pseudomonas sp. TaxID=114707 RepID=UPI002597F0AC|nr:GIY-YIG nuclease family protein [uncultured Pseudomonas sp.]